MGGQCATAWRSAAVSPNRETLEPYRRDGYIVVEGLLDEVTRQRMKLASASHSAFSPAFVAAAASDPS